MSQSNRILVVALLSYLLPIIDISVGLTGPPFDGIGAVTSTTSMFGVVVLGIVHAAEAGWSNPFTLLALGGGSACLVAFGLVEARTPHPMIQLRPAAIAAAVATELFGAASQRRDAPSPKLREVQS
ncbi:MAG: hypothetical protein R3B89_32625 [Polyangiaceae bacterium]